MTHPTTWRYNSNDGNDGPLDVEDVDGMKMDELTGVIYENG